MLMIQIINQEFLRSLIKKIILSSLCEVFTLHVSRLYFDLFFNGAVFFVIKAILIIMKVTFRHLMVLTYYR